MSVNKKGSLTDPQQIEERFAEVFLDAFLNDTSSKYDPDRPLDLSFTVHWISLSWKRMTW